MAKRSIEVMTCDRCGASEEMRRHDQGDDWARINAAQSNGPNRIGSVDGKVSRDICPGCLCELMRWWNAGGTRCGHAGG